MIVLHYQIWSLIFFDTHYRNTSGVILTERFHLNFMFVLSGPHILIVDEVFQEALNICCVGELCCCVPKNPLIWRPKYPRNAPEIVLKKLWQLWYCCIEKTT